MKNNVMVSVLVLLIFATSLYLTEEYEDVDLDGKPYKYNLVNDITMIYNGEVMNKNEFLNCINETNGIAYVILKDRKKLSNLSNYNEEQLTMIKDSMVYCGKNNILLTKNKSKKKNLATNIVSK